MATTFVTAIAFVIAVALPVQAQPPARAHQPTAQTTSSMRAASAAPSLGTPWGTRMEHWLAAGLGMALGAIAVAVGTGFYRYAVDLTNHALDNNTTQSDAGSSVNTANDFLLVAEVLWTAGAAVAAIGLTWVIVLSFSTPVPPAEDETPTVAPAPAPTAELHVTPLGISLEGTF